jgi:hypothetical protein
VPGHWSAISPWPTGLAERSRTDIVTVSRAEVVAALQDAAAREDWAEALVASYVWGQGRTGFGPHRLEEILASSGLADALKGAAAVLLQQGAVAAYQIMDGAVKGLGPAFYTKFLYFLDLALAPSTGPHALILDQRVARVLRAHATNVGLDMGLPSAVSTAEWIWSDGGWTCHRYAVYLKWMTAASEQLRSADPRWAESSPDLLELAFFSGAWCPTA